MNLMSVQLHASRPYGKMQVYTHFTRPKTTIDTATTVPDQTTLPASFLSLGGLECHLNMMRNRRDSAGQQATPGAVQGRSCGLRRMIR